MRATSRLATRRSFLATSAAVGATSALHGNSAAVGDALVGPTAERADKAMATSDNNKPDRGTHFAAPELFVREMRESFKSLR